ncbi:MAG: glycosyltransferase family 4 protein [Hyphomicrobiales bacterium]|nr:glycosyltransferase family 4 protein [Hyphomicrobiales bacterium]
MTRKLVIFQEILMHYRFGFFDHFQKQTGYELTVLYHTPHNEPPDYSETAVRYEQISGKKVGKFAYYPELMSHRAVGEANILVIPGDLQIANLYFLCLGRMFRDQPRVILWGMGYGRSQLARPVRRVIYKIVDAVVFYTKQRKENFTNNRNVDNYFSAPNTLVIPNHGVTSDQPMYFLYVGRLQERKRLDLVLEALAILRKKGFDLSFKIVGSGDEVQRALQTQVNILKLHNHVSFEGAIYDDSRLIKIFSGAHAYISPGHVGLGAVHSIAYGIPVITARNVSHAPEFDHLVEEKSIFLSDLTPESLADMCLRLMREDYKRIRENTYDSFLEKCSMEHMVEGFQEACEFALRKNS